VHGIIKVRVRVDATSEGNVVKTRLQTAGPSKYFARLATQASEQWKFTPPQRNGHNLASAWTLLYEFTRGGATVEASPLNAR
jgi:TonB family protein